MAKLTQFGRMRRRIKRELDAARGERAIMMVHHAAMLSAAMTQMKLTQSALVTAKMLQAWKKELAGELPPEPSETIYSAEPVTKN